MIHPPSPPSGISESSERGMARLWGLIASQAGVYACVACLSRQFDFTSDFAHRPILLVLLLLAVAFALHLWSLRQALRSANQYAITRGILLGAILFRAILLPSLPIQEVDIYRYLWDGAVVAEGGNPYHFSPQQVLTTAQEHNLSSGLKSLVALRARSSTHEETLRQIHYGELITVYPPVSQAVFGAAALAVPDSASLYLRVVTMKVVLTLFDLATVWLLLGILRHAGFHAGWAILYAFSPLVMKEYANSGHLDAIAVCLTSAAVLCLLRGSRARATGSRWSWSALSALLLGLGVGAKLYPVVLIPVLALWTVRNLGWRTGLVYSCITLLSGGLSLGPMLMTEPAVTARDQDSPTTMSKGPAFHEVRADSGLATFLSRWEINDLLFLVVVENLRPDTVNTSPTSVHWFVFLPNSLRAATAEWLSHALNQTIPDATFLIARAITLLIFSAIAGGLLWRATRRNEDELWLRTVFLTIAWFWVLAPTLNPWYWTWALPFLPFAGRRAWTAVSLLVLAYYLRFWLQYQFPESEVLGTNYHGEQFFHFAVAPLEHGLWLSWLLTESLVFREVWPHSHPTGVAVADPATLIVGRRLVQPNNSCRTTPVPAIGTGRPSGSGTVVCGSTPSR